MKKVYVEEWKNYSDVFERQITRKQVISMVRRLKKHFDVQTTRIEFNKYHNASASSYCLNFPSSERISMGMVTHEVAHQFANCRYKENCGHTKKYKKCMKMMITYVRKRNYWAAVYKDTEIDIDYREKSEVWMNSYHVERAIKKEMRKDRLSQREESNLPFSGA